MAIHKPTPHKVATPGLGKYKEGGGLRLVVSTSGAQKWVLPFEVWDQVLTQYLSFARVGNGWLS